MCARLCRAALEVRVLCCSSAGSIWSQFMAIHTNARFALLAPAPRKTLSRPRPRLAFDLFQARHHQRAHNLCDMASAQHEAAGASR